jgi:hypothetical protein
VKLDIAIEYSDYRAEFMIKQLQKELISQPLQVKMIFEDGTSEIETFLLTKRKEKFGWGSGNMPGLKNIEIDPNSKLLHEVELTIEKLD